MVNIFQNLRKRFRRWDRKNVLSKRQQLVAVTGILVVGMVLTQTVTPDYRYPMVVALSILTYMGAAFGLREDLKGIEWLTLLILPTLFTAGVGVFYFLLPVRWLTRIPFALLYAIGMYALLLTENIYNVAANRTIALLRAAHSVGFLLTLVTFFLLSQTILANRLPGIFNAIAIGILSFLLFVQALWSMTLEQGIGKPILSLSVALSFCVTEVTFALGYWPVNTTVASLFFTTCFYGLAGMAQQYLIQRLYKRTIMEFGAVIGIVWFVVLLTTHWRGNF